jgi:hypothetical protein
MVRSRVTIIVAGVLAAGPARAGSWQPLTNPYPAPEIVDPATNTDFGPGGASTPLLLTDGRVLVVNGGPSIDGRVFALSPDENGSYVDGTWSELATMPYSEAAAAQAVLADGRVLIEGGEFTGYFFDFTLTNQGAIYDPVADSWQMVPPPAFFVDLLPRRATPDDREPRGHWAPEIVSAPRVVRPGQTYDLAGVRLNGMSQASAFGDECQNATNYPLVRIENLVTGHIRYSRTHDHSSMAVASPNVVHTFFDVPADQERGRAKLVVVANGIASRPVVVDVR